MVKVKGDQLAAAQQLDGLEDWRMLASGASAWFDAASHTAGAALVGRIAKLAGDSDHAPDVDLRASGVRVRVGATDALSQTDVALAREVSGAARELGLAADSSALQTVQLVIDALDTDAVMPFWSAALRYRRRDHELVDPLRRDPIVAFHAMDSPRPLRNRIHCDIGIARTSDALSSLHRAGAVETFHASYYVTVADPEGNEVCLPSFGGAQLGEGAALADWHAIGSAVVFYPTRSFRQAAQLAAAVANVADEVGIPLLVDLRPGGVTIDSGKDQHEDDDFDLDARFGELAQRVQSAARSMGLAADPTPLRFIQIAIDAVEIPVVQAFWVAVLGYQQDPRLAQDIYDPRRLNPVFWFQQMDPDDHARRKQRNRIQIGLVVPHDQVQTRIDAAVAAGGRIAQDQSPGRWTIADPEGNEIDIVTSAVGNGNV